MSWNVPVFDFTGLLKDARTNPTLPSYGVQLPQIVPDITYPALTGTTIVVGAAGNLQAAINSAVLGDEITVHADFDDVGPFTLPDKGAGTDWIVIRSANSANLTAGVRVSNTQTADMPRIENLTSGAAISLDANAHHWRIVGFEISSDPDYNEAGQLCSQSWSNHHIIWDRCYMHGQATTYGLRRAIQIDGNNNAVIYCHFSDIWESNSDTQCVWMLEGYGILIHDNYMSAAGECFLTGGATWFDDVGNGYANDRMPEDITITKNTFSKPLTWFSGETEHDGQQRSIKNHLELKCGRRVLIEANDFFNFWKDAQQTCIVFKSTNQSGANDQAQVEHITMRYNYWRGVGQWFGITMESEQDPGAYLNSHNIYIHDNLVTDMNFSRVWGVGGATDNRMYSILQTTGNGLGEPAHTNIIIEHNTVVSGQISNGGQPWVESTSTGTIHRNNITGQGLYGLSASGLVTDHAGVISTYMPDVIWTGNVMWSGESGNNAASYPSGNYVPLTNAAIGFENHVDSGIGADYNLASGSAYKGVATDGLDPGVRFNLYDAARV